MRIIGKGLHVLAHACSHLSAEAAAIEETGLAEAQPEPPSRHMYYCGMGIAYSRVLGMLDRLIDGPDDNPAGPW